ncbi:MAG: hypothetical protein HQM12_04125 [SAR324 cluster bacterium]|nr:hypothetical protein [SAR324 cluster bacterium]
MATHSSRRSSMKQNRLVAGMSLLEVMFAMTIGIFLLWMFQQPAGILHEIMVDQTQQSSRNMEIDRMMMVLKAELLQAGYGMEHPASGFSVVSGVLVFEADFNEDGDFQDTREHLEYRFDTEQQKLLRRAGSGNFQTILENVAEITFEKIQVEGNVPGCLLIQIRIYPEESPEKFEWCGLWL